MGSPHLKVPPMLYRWKKFVSWKPPRERCAVIFLPNLDDLPQLAAELPSRVIILEIGEKVGESLIVNRPMPAIVKVFDQALPPVRDGMYPSMIYDRNSTCDWEQVVFMVDAGQFAPFRLGKTQGA